MIKFDPIESGWTLLEKETDLDYHYPKEKYGEYRPQPWFKPERYPCYFRQEALINNSNGADDAILSYIYDYEETN